MRSYRTARGSVNPIFDAARPPAPPGDAASHEQLVERKAVDRGYAKFPVWANGARAGAIRSDTPRLGEHTREVMVELGLDDAEIAALVKKNVVRP